MRPTKSTIGITGGRGTLGKIAATQLTRNGYDIDLFTGDIRNTSDLDQWIKGSAMDALLHFAAIVPTQEVADQPDLAFAVNAEGTKKLLQTLCQHKKNIWFFYASSSHVYASKSIPIKETDAIEPMNMYGKTKLAGEQFLINGAQDFLGTICIGRIFSFYHDTQAQSFLYPAIKKRLDQHNPEDRFELYGAKNARDFLNAEEVIERIIKLMENSAEGVVNIGSGKARTIESFVKEVFNYPDLNIKNMSPEDESVLVADISKYKQLTHEGIDA